MCIDRPFRLANHHLHGSKRVCGLGSASGSPHGPASLFYLRFLLVYQDLSLNGPGSVLLRLILCEFFRSEFEIRAVSKGELPVEIEVLHHAHAGILLSRRAGTNNSKCRENQ